MMNLVVLRNLTILVISRNMVILVNLLILVNHVILVNLGILVNLVILYKLDDSGNFKKYGAFGESAYSITPCHSGEIDNSDTDTGVIDGSEKSDYYLYIG